MKKTRTYSKLKRLRTLEERFEYLSLSSEVGAQTFGYDRYLNQMLYNSKEWKDVRNFVILRDNGCDLGVPGYELYDSITIHHMNPITPEDIINGDESIFDPEYLISVSDRTHRAIHYGDKNLLPRELIVRKKNDTIPWRR